MSVCVNNKEEAFERLAKETETKRQRKEAEKRRIEDEAAAIKT